MKTILALCLSACLFAQQVPTKPPAPVQTQQKSSKKKKWIIIAAVAAGTVIALVAVNKRFGNEGKPIF